MGICQQTVDEERSSLKTWLFLDSLGEYASALSSIPGNTVEELSLP
jgi:hypothetical protein